MIPNLIDRVKKGEEITIYNEGNPRMTPVYITDVVEVIKKALALKGHYVINVGGREAYTIKEMVEAMSNLLRIAPHYKFLTDESRQDLVADITLMKSLLGFEPRTSLAGGLGLMVK